MELSYYSLRQRNGIILTFIILLTIIILLGLQSIAGGLLGSIIIYIIFRPLNMYLQEKKKWNRALSSACILILSFICLVIPLFILSTLIFKQVSFYMENPEQVQAIFTNINAFAADKLQQPDLVTNSIEQIKTTAGDFVSAFVNGAARTFIQVVVMYFILFFITKDFRAFEKALVKYLPFKKENSLRLGNQFINMTYSNILGQGFIAIIQGTLLAVGFLIFGIPNPIFWGVVGIFLSMIPMFGAPLIFVPAGIILLSNDHTVSGIGIIIYGYLIVSTVDNFIRMALGKKIANTHPLITIIGVVIGVPLFGILGILYGPLVLSVFIILLEIYETNRREIAKSQGDVEETELI